MALTKKDLQDEEMMEQTELEPLNTRLESYRDTQRVLIADLAYLKSTIENNTNMLKAVRADFARISQHITEKINLILELCKKREELRLLNCLRKRLNWI